MVDPELPTGVDDAAAGPPRATAISGVPESAVPVLFASASRSSHGIAGALSDLRSSSQLAFAETPPFGVAKAPSLLAEQGAHAALHIAVEDVSLLAARAIEDSRSVASITASELGPGIALPLAAAPAVRAQARAAALALQAAHQTLVERATERFVQRDHLPLSAAATTAGELALGLLPAATRTSVYLSASAHALSTLCHKLLSHPLAEVASAARAILEAARGVAPDLFTLAEGSRMHAAAPSELSRAIAKLYTPPAEGSSATMVISQPVRLVRHDKDALERVTLALAYDRSDPAVHAFALSGSLRTAKDASLIELVQGLLRARAAGELVPRGFEAASMTFEIMVDAATLHDLLRHRAYSASTQRLTCRLGFQTPEDLLDLGLADLYQDAMMAAQASWSEIEAQNPLAAEYVVPLGYRVRSLWTLDLRQLFHLIERRSAKDNPMAVRRVAHGLYRTAAAVLPWLRDLVKVDLD